MPPEIAARQAGRSLAGAPPPTSWLLWLAPAAGQQWAPNDQGMCVILLHQLAAVSDSRAAMVGMQASDLFCGYR